MFIVDLRLLKGLSARSDGTVGRGVGYSVTEILAVLGPLGPWMTSKSTESLSRRGLEPFAQDGGVVNEDVFSAFPFDEIEALLIIEPLDSTLHSKPLL
jgi:hypothetical protein